MLNKLANYGDGNKDTDTYIQAVLLYLHYYYDYEQLMNALHLLLLFKNRQFSGTNTHTQDRAMRQYLWHAKPHSLHQDFCSLHAQTPSTRTTSDTSPQ